MSYKFFALWGCVISLLSCGEDINLERYRQQPRLVLNALASTDTLVMADISDTWFYTDDKAPDGHVDFSVKLFVNGQERCLMTYSDGKYRSPVRPRPGDELGLKAAGRDGSMLAAYGFMPAKVDIADIEVSRRKVPGPTTVGFDSLGRDAVYDYRMEYTFRIHFVDKAAGPHYYYAYIHHPKGGVTGLMDFSMDPAFQATIQEVNQSISTLKEMNAYGLPFSNSTYNGQEYTLTIAENGSPLNYRNPDMNWREVIIYSISEDYYRYMVSMLSNYDGSWYGEMSAKGMAEPVKIHSNVKDGTGIFACVTVARKTIRLPD